MSRFEDRYKNNDIPWDTTRPDFNITNYISKGKVKPCKALEIGCGTGENAIWLSRKGYTVKAVDISANAIEMAKERSQAHGVEVDFEAIDFIATKPNSSKFDFVYDRACFHSMKTDEEKKAFVDNVYRNLKQNGIWFSLIGSTDSPHEGSGPPKLSATEITSLVEPKFKILSLKAGVLDSDSEVPPDIWILELMKR